MSDDNWDDDQESNNCVSSNYNNGTNFGMGRGLPQNKNYESLNAGGYNNGYGSGDNRGNDRRPGKSGYGQSYNNRNNYSSSEKSSGFEVDNNSFNFDSSTSGFGNTDQDNGYGPRRGGGGGGGRGGRGGRGFGRGGGRGGGFGSRNNDRYDENGGEARGFGGGRSGCNGGGERNFRGNDDNGEGYGGGFRNYGGYGRNDNRKDTGYRGRREGENDDQPEKPREIYIPPELFDENTVYGSGVKAGINFNKYNSIEVNTSGNDIPPPIETFREANFRSLLQENIEKSKYKMPTPVQKYAFSILMANRDLMACAQTGSGKTAAFMIPIVHKLLEQSRDNFNSSSVAEPRAVIITPTRELTTQIYNQARKFANHSTLRCRQLYGGTSVEYQLKQLLGGCDILVATPGRLLDLVQRRKITFNAVDFLVLDEADKMLDMGFNEDVEKIFRHNTMVPTGERRTLMFSATFPARIQELAARYMNNYIFVAVGVIGGACTDIEQTFFKVSKRDKRSKLDELLRLEADHNTLSGILVFVDMKKTADFIAAFLSENNFPTTSIHGDRLQREREEALEDFKTGRMAILVATAVAARGLDIENVSHVINYDLPKDIDEYIHRIGRTGRVGNKGKATSFYDESIDYRLQEDLVRVLSVSGQVVPQWLSGSNVYDDYEPASTFGGHDIRNFSDVQNISEGGTLPIEDDENW